MPSSSTSSRAARVWLEPPNSASEAIESSDATLVTVKESKAEPLEFFSAARFFSAVRGICLFPVSELLELERLLQTFLIAASDSSVSSAVAFDKTAGAGFGRLTSGKTSSLPSLTSPGKDVVVTLELGFVPLTPATPPERRNGCTLAEEVLKEDIIEC